MEKQQIFNQVCEHLIRQGEQSLDNNGEACYLSPSGAMDPIGYLLQPAGEMLNQIANDQTCRNRAIRLALQVKGIDYNLAYDLQVLHDTIAPHEWPIALADLAAKHKLLCHGKLAEKLFCSGG